MLTPEWEQLIRDDIKNHVSISKEDAAIALTIRVLLDEIDRLRNAHVILREVSENYRKERDQLREKLNTAVSALEEVPGTLMKLAKLHMDATGNLTQEQKIWSHDTCLVVSGWVESYVIKPALEKIKGSP